MHRGQARAVAEVGGNDAAARRRRAQALASKTQAFHERVLDEILQEPLACRRGRRNLRGVKRKMSNWPLCRRRATPLQAVVISNAIFIVK